MSYSKDIYNAFVGFLKESSLQYTFDQKKEMFCLDVPVKCSLHSVKMYVKLYDTRYSVYAMMPYHAEKECRAQVAELIARINYGKNFGFFETDVRDGEVRFRVEMDCDGRVPSLYMMRDSIMVAMMNVEQCGDVLVKVMLGIASVKDVRAKI